MKEVISSIKKDFKPDSYISALIIQKKYKIGYFMADRILEYFIHTNKVIKSSFDFSTYRFKELK